VTAVTTRSPHLSPLVNVQCQVLRYQLLFSPAFLVFLAFCSPLGPSISIVRCRLPPLPRGASRACLNLTSTGHERTFSTRPWRTRSSDEPLRRTWALQVPVRANKHPRLRAHSPDRAIHISTRCECDTEALEPGDSRSLTLRYRSIVQGLKSFHAQMSSRAHLSAAVPRYSRASDSTDSSSSCAVFSHFVS
jgi:hypothetical protein